MLATVLAALARLLRLLTRLLLSAALLLLARLLAAAAMLLATLARTRSALLLLVRIPLVRVIHSHSPRGLTWFTDPRRINVEQ
jgi:hypothetical protein